MSDDGLSIDPVPEERPGSTLAVRRGMGARWVAILAVVVTAGIVAALYLQGVRPDPEISDVPRGPGTIDTTPGGARQEASPEYREGLSAVNEQGWQRASEEGRTFVPTPEAIPDRIDPDMLSPAPRPFSAPPAPDTPPATGEALPAPVVLPPPPRPEPRDAIGAPAPQTAETPAMLEMMQALVAGWKPPTSVTATLERGQQQDRPEGTGPAGARQIVPTPAQAAGLVAGPPQAGAGPGVGGIAATSGPTVPLEIVMRPGDILYAETITSLTSDLPGPVVVDVIQGEHLGARLVGEFQLAPSADGLLIEFRSITLADGRTTGVTAFAVDPVTAESQVASSVDRRWLARFAPGMAASFVAGLAASAAQGVGTALTLGSGTVVQLSSAERSTRQHLASGLAAAGEKAADLIQDAAPTGPEIRLESGTGLAVLIVDPVQVPVEEESND